MREWLRELRATKGYSQSSMADAIGVTRQYYNYIETGKRLDNLPLDVAGKLADLLGITLEDIRQYEEVKSNAD